MRIGFTGTREGMTSAQAGKVAEWMHHCTAREFHHGDCIGADEGAHELARLRGWTIVVHPGNQPSMRAHAAGYRSICAPKSNLARNRDIVDETVHLLACPKGYTEEPRGGTWYTIRYARKLGRGISIIWPDGTYTFEESRTGRPWP